MNDDNSIRLLWVVIRKAGGEVRLNQRDLLLHPNWTITEIPEPMTGDVVLKAGFSKIPPTLVPHDLRN